MCGVPPGPRFGPLRILQPRGALSASPLGSYSLGPGPAGSHLRPPPPPTQWVGDGGPLGLATFSQPLPRARCCEAQGLPSGSTRQARHHLACVGVPSPPSDAEGPPAPPPKKGRGHGTSPVAHRRLTVCRGQPPPDCRQRPKMRASHNQVPLAAALLDSSEGAALGRAKRMAIVWPTAALAHARLRWAQGALLGCPLPPELYTGLPATSALKWVSAPAPGP